MKDFAALLDRLLYAPDDETKIALLGRYFRAAAGPERGWGLALLASELDLRAVKPAAIRKLVAGRSDPVLFDLSHDYVGDLAETCALLWPERPGTEPPRLGDIVAGMQGADRGELPSQMARWLDGLDANGRWTMIKLVAGGFRSGVSARLAKAALAEAFGKPLAAIEEIWHGLEAPYAPLFAWLEGAAAQPEPAAYARIRPFMLARAIERLDDLDAGEWQVEWLWDGIRVQLVAAAEATRLYSRAGDELSAAFPDVLAGMRFRGVIDGELLVRGADGEPAPFDRLRQRLGRKPPSRKLQEQNPAIVRAHDMLFLGDEDWRGRPLRERRRALEETIAAHPHERLDLSPILHVGAAGEMTAFQAEARRLGRAGLMFKRRISVYGAGRIGGAWYKWKCEPQTADAVLMYAQRGGGKRTAFFSNYTFGVWRGAELVPVGKARADFAEDELKRLDRWIRDNTVDRFGPVCAVGNALVFEVEFVDVNRSARHKSGLALRSPRIRRIRWDKLAADADRIEALQAKLAVHAVAAKAC